MGHQHHGQPRSVNGSDCMQGAYLGPKFVSAGSISRFVKFAWGTPSHLGSCPASRTSGTVSSVILLHWRRLLAFVMDRAALLGSVDVSFDFPLASNESPGAPQLDSSARSLMPKAMNITPPTRSLGRIVFHGDSGFLYVSNVSDALL